MNSTPSFQRDRPSAGRPVAHRRSGRDGYLYISVLFTTLIVFSVVTAALTISTNSSRSQTLAMDSQSARLLADSELQRLIADTRDRTDWNASQTSGVWSAWRNDPYVQAIGGSDASVRHRWTDNDGDLSDRSFDSLALDVQSRVGASQYAIACGVESDPVAEPWLGDTVTAVSVAFYGNHTLSTDGPMSISYWTVRFLFSGAEIVTPLLRCNTNLVKLYGELESWQNNGAPTPELNSTTLLTRYPDGTVINRNALFNGSDYLLDNQWLSPTNNPFGTADPTGVYRIDMGGNKLIVRNMRIRGTLVIEDASRVEITDGVDWRYPLDRPDACLVTDSRVTFVDLDSEIAAGFGFPVTPSRVQGLIYSTENVETYETTDGQPVEVRGSVIAKNLILRSPMRIRKIEDWAIDPAPALSSQSQQRWIMGTKRRATWVD